MSASVGTFALYMPMRDEASERTAFCVFRFLDSHHGCQPYYIWHIAYCDPQGYVNVGGGRVSESCAKKTRAFLSKDI